MRNPLHVRPHRTRVERAWHPEGPGERSASVGEVDAPEVRMHGGTSTWETTRGVGGEDSTDHHDTQ